LTQLSAEARQRLETMREATDLGAGYTIAMRDLEIRGAGDILGARQSGHVAAVGFGLYTRLLSRAVQELRAQRRGEPPPPEPLDSIRIELPIPVRLPEEYVADDGLRLKIYRRLANLDSMADVDAIERELADRFGPLPIEGENLIYQLRLKALARDAGVDSIVQVADQLVLHAAHGDILGRGALQTLLAGRARVRRREVRLPLQGPSWRALLEETLQQMAAQQGDA
jgi:transcription-repair coupling factor (superfamily II helicase)